MATIHYRRLSRATAGITSASLYDAISGVMQKRNAAGSPLASNVLDRRQDCPDGHTVVLNAYTRAPDFVFAEILRLEPGAHLVTVRRKAGDTEVLEVAQYNAPEGDTPLRGAAYVFIKDDHFLFTTRGHLTSGCLEDYITWLLHRSPIILPLDRRIALDLRTPRRADLPAREMRLQMAPIEQEKLPDRGRPQPRERRTPASESILRTLAVTDADLGQMIGEGAVEVDVVLRFKEGWRRRSVRVGTLENMFRNVEDVDAISFDGPYGPVSELGARLRGEKRIATVGSLFDATDARQRLGEQFAEWRQQGHIDANARAHDA